MLRLPHSAAEPQPALLVQLEQCAAASALWGWRGGAWRQPCRLEKKLGLISCGLEIPAETWTEQRGRTWLRRSRDAAHHGGGGLQPSGADNQRARLTRLHCLSHLTGGLTYPPPSLPPHCPGLFTYSSQLWKHADDIIHSETSFACGTAADLPPRINDPVTLCFSSLTEPITLSSANFTRSRPAPPNRSSSPP